MRGHPVFEIAIAAIIRVVQYTHAYLRVKSVMPGFNKAKGRDLNTTVPNPSFENGYTSQAAGCVRRVLLCPFFLSLSTLSFLPNAKSIQRSEQVAFNFLPDVGSDDNNLYAVNM